MQQNNIKIGDKFLNPITNKVNTIIEIETYHYYPGDKSHGTFYTLSIEGTNKTINLTPAMLSRFTQL